MRKLTFTFLLICLLASINNLRAQQVAPPSIQWEGVYGGFQNDYAYTIKQTTDGGYIFGGYSASDVSGNKTTPDFGSSSPANDYWVVKTDAKGAIQWQKSYGGDKSDVLYEIELTKDGGYILLGTSSSSISGNKTDTNRAGTASTLADLWIVKIDDTGKIQWQKTLGGTGTESLASTADVNTIQQTFDGGYIVACASTSGKNGDKTDTLKGTTSADWWILKLDGNGAIQWQKDLGSNGTEAIASIRQTVDSGYLAFGYASTVLVSGLSVATGDKTDTGRGSNDYWLVKLDKTGAIQWQKTLGGASAEYAADAWITKDGGYILSGYTQSGKTGDKTDTAKGSNDLWIVKLDANRNIQWQKDLGSKSNDAIYAFLQMQNGHYFIDALCTNNSASGAAGRANAKSGDRTDTGVAIYDTWLMEIDTAGSIIWQKAIGASKAGAYATTYNNLQYPALTSDGGIVLGGYSNGDSSAYKTVPPMVTNVSSTSASDYWIVKMGVNLVTANDSICRYGIDTLHNGIVINTAGEYRDTIFKNNSIDSVFVTNLSIIHVDTSVSQTGITLTSNAIGATYQWMYCATNQAVPGATLVSFTPIADGDYKVAITKNGCTDTSSCHSVHGVGVQSVQGSVSTLSVYPNPTTGMLNIATGNTSATMRVQIINMLGSALLSETFSGNTATMDISGLAAGTYLVKVSNDNSYSLVKVTKVN